MTDLVELVARAICDSDLGDGRSSDHDHCGEKMFKMYEDEARAVLSALRDAGAIMEWRPIEEAPKDGTQILVYPALFEMPLVAAWEKPTPPMMMPRAPARRHNGFWRAALTLKSTPYTPTHFMHLPKGPSDD